MPRHFFLPFPWLPGKSSKFMTVTGSANSTYTQYRMQSKGSPCSRIAPNGFSVASGVFIATPFSRFPSVLPVFARFYGSTALVTHSHFLSFNHPKKNKCLPKCLTSRLLTFTTPSPLPAASSLATPAHCKPLIFSLFFLAAG